MDWLSPAKTKGSLLGGDPGKNQSTENIVLEWIGEGTIGGLAVKLLSGVHFHFWEGSSHEFNAACNLDGDCPKCAFPW